MTEKMRTKLLTVWNSNKKELLFCICSTFIIGLIAHAFIFFNNDMSHDWLNAFVATETEELWKVSLMRYIVPLYRNLVRNSIALPWLIGALSLLWYSLAVYLVCRIFDLKSPIAKVLVAGVMVTNITVIAQNAAYLYEADFNALSLLLAVAGVYVWHKNKKVPYLLLSGVCFFISMGIYQAYFSTALVLALFVCIFELIDGEKAKKVIVNALKGLATIAVSTIAFYLTSKVVSAVFGIEGLGRVDALETISSNLSPLKLIQLLKGALYDAALGLLHTSYSKQFIFASVAITAFISAFFFIALVVKRKTKISNVITALVLLACIPFAMASMYILAGHTIHDLVRYSACFYWVAVIVLAFRCADAGVLNVNVAAVTKFACCAVVALVVWQNIVIANTAYIKKNIVAQSTLSTMTRVVGMIEDHEEYVFGETQIAFIGMANVFEYNEGPLIEIYDFTECSWMIGVDGNCAIQTDTVTSYYNSYKAYMTYVMNYPVVFCPDAKREELKQSEAVQNMPAFPNKECIQIIDGIMVVKVGQNYAW